MDDIDRIDTYPDENPRKAELWSKWRHYERFTTEEMEEALALRVGFLVGGSKIREDDERWPRVRLLWTKALRVRHDARELPYRSDEWGETSNLGIDIRYPQPSDEEIARNDRRHVLQAKQTKKEPFTREDCDEAIACEYLLREDVEEYFNFLDTVRKRGYEPHLQGGIECSGVDIHNFPRTPDGGYEIPSLLDDVEYRGSGMYFIDTTGPDGRHSVSWIGQHRQTGKLVARLEVPPDAFANQKPEPKPTSWGEKLRAALFGAPKVPPPGALVGRMEGGVLVMDVGAGLSAYDTPDYKCVWLS